MTRSGDVEDHSTRLLVEAGDILRTLNPPTFASLVLLIDEDTYTQSEMGDIIGCSRTSISRYMQSMMNVPIALVMKQGQQYTVTKAGRSVVRLVHDMSNQVGIDLSSVKLVDENEQEAIADLFTPLHDSRSSLPFFILYSISAQSAEDDQINQLDTSRSVRVEEVVNDVEARQQESGKSVDTEQIRRTLWRFDRSGAITFDGSRLTLTEKGCAQAHLLTQLTKLVADQRRTEASRPEDADQALDPEGQNSDNFSQQIMGHRFSGGGQSSATTVNSVPTTAPDSPVIEPAYCLRLPNTPPTGIPSGEDSQYQHVLPLRNLSIMELITRLNHLLDEYGEDAQLEPYLVLRSESGLYPLGPAQLPLADARSDVWDLVNKAHRLWNE